MKSYHIYYRKRNDKNGVVFNTTIDAPNRAEALKSAKIEFNRESGYTVVGAYLERTVYHI